jgi:hypothetical protein
MTTSVRQLRTVAPRSFLLGTFLFWHAMIAVPIFSILVFLAIYLWLFYYAIRTDNRYLLTAAIAYTLRLFLDKAPRNGGWTMSTEWRRWFRNYPGFRYLGEYFDARIIKEKDLDPTQQYIFVYHPHGIIGIGACCHLATNGADFETHFPGVSSFLDDFVVRY